MDIIFSTSNASLFHLHIHAWYHYLLKVKSFPIWTSKFIEWSFKFAPSTFQKYELLSVHNTHQQYYRANMNESLHEKTTMLKVAQTSKARTIQNSWASQIAYLFLL